MPLPLVVVEVPAQDRGTAESAVLLEACTAALGSGRCELTEPANAGPASAVAIVSWRDEERLNALVEVARAQQRNEGWRSEELHFKREDRKLERFRTLGLTIATLFREASSPQTGDASGASDAATPKKEAGARAEPGKPLSPKPAPAKPAPAKTERAKTEDLEDTEAVPPAANHGARHPAQASVSAGGLASYDPKLGTWHYGGQLKLEFGAAAFPGFVSALGSYATGPALGGVSLDWARLGLGPGLRFTLSPGVELRGVALGVLANVSGRAQETERENRQSVWVPGAAFGLELGLRANRRVGVSIGAEVQQLAGNVPIREHGELAGTVGKTSFGLTLALEFWLLGGTAIGD